MVRKYGKKAAKKIERVMREFKRGELKTSGGRKVTSREQAIAIGLSEARARGYKVPAQPAHATKLGAVARMKRRKSLAARGIKAAGVRTFSDTGQTQAYVEWSDGSRTIGSPENPHMQALLARAKREGVRVNLGEVF